MQPFVSVIIPVYNVENYLYKCISSVTNQTLKEIEIIVIDDGSTDSSAQILDRMAKEDSRIQVVHNTNHGYGYSINSGIKLAKGEYIGIVESDDSIDADMYENLYRVAKDNKLDFVKSNRKEVEDQFDGKERVIEKKLVKCVNLYNRIIKPTEHIEMYFSAPDTWSGIYNRNFLYQNDIWHNETPGASYQDIGFAFQVYTLAEKCMLLDRGFYRYKVDNMGSSIHDPQKIYTVCGEYDFVYSFLEKNRDKISVEVYRAYYIKKYGAYLSTIARIHENHLFPFLERFRKDYLNDCQKEYFEEELFEGKQIERIKKILESPANYEKDFLKSNIKIYEKVVAPYKRVIIYGNGMWAMRLWKSWNPIQNNVKNIKFCFAISVQPEEDFFENVPLYKIDNLIDYSEETLVIVAVGCKLREELIRNIERLGFKNYMQIDNFFELAKQIRSAI